MKINGASEYQEAYTKYNRPDISTVKEEQQIEQSIQPKDSKQVFTANDESPILPEPSVQTEQPGKMADLENISLTFNAEESYDYIGQDSNIENLDMQKAISDMRRDQILEQYQYFVGSSQDLLQVKNTEDGIVFPKFHVFPLT